MLLFSALIQNLSRTYQQLPRSPCEMSSGRGVLHTAHLTFSSPCREAAISVGLSHWMYDFVNGLFSFRNTDVGAGGKESSTKWSLCWITKIYIVSELKHLRFWHPEKRKKSLFQFDHSILLRKLFKIIIQDIYRYIDVFKSKVFIFTEKNCFQLN